MTQDPTALETQAVDMARREILSPTLAATSEVLSVHTPVLVDGQPLIAHADTTREPDAYYFYFRLEGEPYYLVVVVRRAGDHAELECACVEPAVRVFLLVKAQHLTPDEISERLGLEPTAAYAKGEHVHPELPPLAQTMWRLEPHQTLPAELSRKLDLLLDELEPAAPRIAELAKETEITLSICYEGCKDWLGGWDADPRALRRIADLGVHLQFDLYASGPDLPGLE
jgi:hypothetical protein